MSTPDPRLQPLSPWALIALACSVGLCPAVTILGVIFSLLAFRDIRRRGRRGRRLALVALILSLVVTPATTLALVGWNAWVRAPMLAGPLVGLQAGQSGYIPEMLESFEGGTAAEAHAFLRQLNSRFGSLQAIQQDPDGEAIWQPRGWGIAVPYLFDFSGSSVPGAAQFVVVDADGRGPICRFAWVRIGEASPLVFPPSAESAAMAQMGDEDDD